MNKTKKKPKKNPAQGRHSLSWLSVILQLTFLAGSVGMVCWLLYADNALPGSISSVWQAVSRYVGSGPFHGRLVTVGFLPVYVALMVFGGAFLGVAAGYAILAFCKRLVRRFC